MGSFVPLGDIQFLDLSGAVERSRCDRKLRYKPLRPIAEYVLKMLEAATDERAL